MASCGGGSLPAAEEPVALATTDTGLAQQAVSTDEHVAAAAIAALRLRGPEGLEVLLQSHRDEITALREHPPLQPSASIERLRHAIDIVSGQRDGFMSGLFWYTDLDAATAEARRTHRPVLSLRLLGRLDEELSCANSRYFRVVLYADPTVSAHLREHFVLHWSSERPAPRITIDMGDGRQMVRTITGNSVHYVLDSNGRPVDAIVGLYDAQGFLSALGESESTLEQCQTNATADCIARVHGEQLAALRARWEQGRALDITRPSYEDTLATLAQRSGATLAAPSATVAMAMTVGKRVVETPMLRMMERTPTVVLDREPNWTAIANRTAVLSAQSRSLMQLKTHQANVDDTAQRLAQSAVADGARNDMLYRPAIHAWFAEQSGLMTFEALNTRVYSELLLTPASDPWLGLHADDLYDGLEVQE
jgi:hypothetical protein